MKWFKIEVPINELQIQKIKVNHKEICLVKKEDDIFACNVKCPHAGADLSQGWIQDGKIVCPFHRHEYNLSNGKGAAGQGDYLPVYQVERREDGLYIKLPENWLKKIFNRIISS